MIHRLFIRRFGKSLGIKNKKTERYRTNRLNESERALMTICLKADRYTTMGRITEIKQELRRANALKISYAAAKTLGY